MVVIKIKVVRMVVIKIKAVRQYDIVVITVNPDITYTSVKKMRKCSIYIALNDFN